MEFTGRQISRAAFDVLWRKAMPNVAKPVVLYGESPGATGQRRGQLEREADAELRHAGYTSPRDAKPEVADALDLVARPQFAIDVRRFEWAPGDAQQPWRLVRLTARVAARGWRGAAALLAPGWFQAWSFPAGSLVNEVIRLFPSHEAPARFAGLSLAPDQLAPFPPRRGEEVLRLMEEPFLRRAHLCVVTRDPVGGIDRVSDGLVLNDIAAGRYLVFMARNKLTIVPGHRVTFERKLKELLEPARPY